MKVQEFWSILSQEDWEDSSYTDSKALICGFFSEIAYREIHNNETIDDKNRSQIIPCSAFEKALLKGEKFQTKYVLQKYDLPKPIIITTDNSVSVVIHAANVIFIATRGTICFHDLLVDLDAFYTTHNLDGTEYLFHSGFYTVALEILHKLKKHKECIGNSPIYFVGHSLGGALSANMNIFFKGQNQKQSYTFGMPRYCNNAVFENFPIPNSIVNPNDVITTLPSYFAQTPYKNTRIIEPNKYDVEVPNTLLLPQHRLSVYINTLEKILLNE